MQYFIIFSTSVFECCYKLYGNTLNTLVLKRHRNNLVNASHPLQWHKYGNLCNVLSFWRACRCALPARDGGKVQVMPGWFAPTDSFLAAPEEMPVCPGWRASSGFPVAQEPRLRWTPAPLGQAAARASLRRFHTRLSLPGQKTRSLADVTSAEPPMPTGLGWSSPQNRTPCRRPLLPAKTASGSYVSDCHHWDRDCAEA